MKQANLVNGTGREVGLLIARMAVRRALRQCPELQHRSTYILAADLPNDSDTTLYERAFELELQSTDPEGPGRNTLPEFRYFADKGGSSKHRRQNQHELFSIDRSLADHQRLIGVGTPKQPISDTFKTLAEAVIDVRPTKDHLQAALITARDFHLSDYIARDMIAHSASNLSIAFRGNRPLKAALEVLDALTAAQASNGTTANNVDNVLPFEEMSGYGEAKVWGLELAHDFKEWKAGELPWSDVDRGALFYGISGTGKTIFAKALADFCGAKFVECSLAKAQALGHLGDMLKGLNNAFDYARRNKPAILFIDEFDSIGNRETLSRHAPEYATQLINGLLELLDGSERRDGVVIVAACNRLETIDRALLRPGRLERIIEILPPDHAARRAIFSQHLKYELPESDLNEIGRLTNGWTGAELERLARDCRRSARRSGKAMNAQQTINTLNAEMTKVSPALLERFAVHEAGHVVAAYVIRGIIATEVAIRDYVRVTNGSRIENGGHTAFPANNSGSKVRSDYLNSIAVLLAGHAAEELFFDEASDGSGLVAGSDLERATIIAARLEASTGLSDNLVFRAEITGTDLKYMLRDNPEFANECAPILKDQLRRVRLLLGRNMTTLKSISAELLQRKTLSFNKIKTLLVGKTI